MNESYGNHETKHERTARARASESLRFVPEEGIRTMSHDLVRLYQEIQREPALAIDIPKDLGKWRITRLDTNNFSLSSWNMEFNRDTYVEGNVAKDMRLLFCCGEGVEWVTSRGVMNLDPNEACFCLSDGSPEKMCYQGNTPFSFLSVSMPTDRFVSVIDEYLPEPERMMALLPGKRFSISGAIQKNLCEVGTLECVDSGFARMRLDARMLESLSLCLQAALCEPAKRRKLHQDDVTAIRTLGRRIEEAPADIPDTAALACEYCMSVSKLTRSFRQVYGVPLHAYVIASRLQKGAELLTHDGISVQEIAETVGYAKSSQFSADFRKRFGVLPGEYRRRL